VHSEKQISECTILGLISDKVGFYIFPMRQIIFG